ncbi:MAG: 30S ribosome-binding factor RbfA [Planctomycetota bacterium]
MRGTAVVASAIVRDIRDPRVKDVTVISVDVTPDMREAKVNVSVMGDESQKQLSIRGLQNSAGFLQSKIGDRLDTRYTPRLKFALDKGQENAMAVGEILARIRREKEADSDEPTSSASTGVSAGEDDAVDPDSTTLPDQD